MLIEIRHLRYIVAVARHTSFRKAAEALRLGQPTLSRGVREAEDELGVQLFRRSPRGTVLTDAGREFIAYAEQILEELDFAISRAKSCGKGVGGRLIVGFYPSLSRGNLLTMLAEQNRRRPETELAIMNGPRSHLLSALNAGTLDVAIMTDDRTRWDDGQLRVWSERVVVALPKDHRLASKSVVSWRALRDETFLFSQTDPGPELQAILMSKVVPHGDLPRIVVQDAVATDIMSLVRIGRGITLVWKAALAVMTLILSIGTCMTGQGRVTATLRPTGIRRMGIPPFTRFLMGFANVIQACLTGDQQIESLEMRRFVSHGR